MPPVRSLKNYLRMFRKRSGLTQAELAGLLGCAHGSKVYRYEHGIRIPTLQTVIAFEIVFRVPVAALFTGTYEKVRGDVRARAQRLSRQLDAKPFTPAQKQKLEALVAVIYPPKDRGAA
jgi:transcriptional regulator with XRE-family HTH domain